MHSTHCIHTCYKYLVYMALQYQGTRCLLPCMKSEYLVIKTIRVIKCTLIATTSKATHQEQYFGAPSYEVKRVLLSSMYRWYTSNPVPVPVPYMQHTYTVLTF